MAKHFQPEKLHRLRQARGLTQGQVGEKASVSVAAVAQIEKGLKEPKVNTLSALAGALNKNIGYFFA